MSNLTYKDMARHYGLTLRELKWDDRQVTVSGLRRFLVAVYSYRLWRLAYLPDDQWQFIHRGNQWAYNEALEVWHRRIPARLADEDKARVAAMLVGKRPADDGSTAAALAWAKRRSKVA